MDGGYVVDMSERRMWICQNVEYVMQIINYIIIGR